MEWRNHCWIPNSRTASTSSVSTKPPVTSHTATNHTTSSSAATTPAPANYTPTSHTAANPAETKFSRAVYHRPLFWITMTTSWVHLSYRQSKKGRRPDNLRVQLLVERPRKWRLRLILLVGTKRVWGSVGGAASSSGGARREGGAPPTTGSGSVGGQKKNGNLSFVDI